jgi:hypothetical protein
MTRAEKIEVARECLNKHRMAYCTQKATEIVDRLEEAERLTKTPPELSEKLSPTLGCRDDQGEGTFDELTKAEVRRKIMELEHSNAKWKARAEDAETLRKETKAELMASKAEIARLCAIIEGYECEKPRGYFCYQYPESYGRCQACKAKAKMKGEA